MSFLTTKHMPVTAAVVRTEEVEELQGREEVEAWEEEVEHKETPVQRVCLEEFQEPTQARVHRAMAETAELEEQVVQLTGEQFTALAI